MAGKVRAQMKRLLTLLVVLIIAAGLVACNSETSETPPAGASAESGERPVLKIGTTFTLSGAEEAIGNDQKAAMELFLNARDWQIGPYDVEVIVEDDAGNVETALDRVEKLVDADNVDFLFGSHMSDVGTAIAEYAVSARVPYIIPCVAADDLTQRGHNNLLIRTGWGASQATHPFGYWAYTQGLRRIAIVAVDTTLSYETAAGFRRTFEEAGGEVTAVVWTPNGAPDFVPFLAQVPRDVDAIWMNYMGDDAARALAAFRDMGFEMPILGGTALTDEHILFELDEEAVLNGRWGTFTINQWVETDAAPHVRAFADAFYEETGRRASSFAMESYVAFQLIEAAILEAGGFAHNFPAFLEAIRATEVITAKGRVMIDQWNNPIQDFHVRRVERIPARGELANVNVFTFPAVSQFWLYDPEEFLVLPPYDKSFDTAAHNRLLATLRGES